MWFQARNLPVDHSNCSVAVPKLPSVLCPILFASTFRDEDAPAPGGGAGGGAKATSKDTDDESSMSGSSDEESEEEDSDSFGSD